MWRSLVRVRVELAFVEDPARRAALAVVSATSYELERRAADMLLRSLLPEALPSLPGLQTGVRYLPGAAGARIGGDWYDVFALPDGTVAFVVGDVMGQGVPAATAMSQMRASLRAHAFAGHGPGATLDRLDALVDQVDELHLTTCICATLDSATGVVRVASAGHLPPLLVDADGEVAFLDLEAGLPLGVGLQTGGYPEHRLVLRDGGALLLYTDGLVESRVEPIDVGLDRLRAEAVAAADESPQGLCDAVVAGTDERVHPDDIAVLAVRYTPTLRRVAEVDRNGARPSAEASIALLLDRRSPARGRAFAREQLEQWDCQDVADDVALLTSELITNAQLHGDAPLHLHLRRSGPVLRVEVEDASDRLPTVRDYGLEAGTGRGMLLLGEIATRWGADPTAGGKIVWFEVAV